jgi:glyoxylase-like metal-dependent hydrolase (beta-lactamase superfamily II)
MRLVGNEGSRVLPDDVRAVPRKATEARASEIAEGLWCLRLPLPYPAPATVNCYLIEGADGYCLVDCGTSLEPGWAALTKALERAAVDPRHISLLVLTHLHSDHAGAAATVIDQTGCELARAPGPDTVNDAVRDARSPLDERSRLALGEGVPEAELDLWVNTNLADDGHHPQVVPDRLLGEGDSIPTRLGGWRVVPIPGHSPTHMALVERTRRWMISADLAYGRGTPFFEYGHSPDPVAEHIESLRRAERLVPNLLLPGHGRAIGAPLQVLTRARNASLAACSRVRRLVSAEPQTPFEVALALMGDQRNTNRRQEALVLVLSVLRHFELRGEIRSETGADGVRRIQLSCWGEP